MLARTNTRYTRMHFHTTLQYTCVQCSYVMNAEKSFRREVEQKYETIGMQCNVMSE